MSVTRMEFNGIMDVINEAWPTAKYSELHTESLFKTFEKFELSTVRDAISYLVANFPSKQTPRPADFMTACAEQRSFEFKPSTARCLKCNDTGLALYYAIADMPADWPGSKFKKGDEWCMACLCNAGRKQVSANGVMAFHGETCKYFSTTGPTIKLLPEFEKLISKTVHSNDQKQLVKELIEDLPF